MSSIRIGDTVHVTIARNRTSERGTFTVTAREHADVAGLLVATITEQDREIVLQRPNGEQPFAIEVAR